MAVSRISQCCPSPRNGLCHSPQPLKPLKLFRTAQPERDEAEKKVWAGAYAPAHTFFRKLPPEGR